MTLLDRLAERVGIAPGYHDVEGTWFETSGAAKRAILAAMGIPAETGDDQAASLARLEEAPWRTLVEPVSVVADEAQPGHVPVTLPADTTEPLVWQIALENGGTRDGVTAPSRMHLVERRALDGAMLERRMLALPGDLPLGYHRLRLVSGGTVAESTIIVAPKTCWGPDDIVPGERFVGLACQLYSLRGEADWGIGHFGDLRNFAVGAGAAGVDLVGVNPLHALFLADPAQASPYSPASRDWLNALYIDPTAVPDFAESEPARRLVSDTDFQQRLEKARHAELIDYREVAELLLPVLELLFDNFRDRHLARGTERARGFRSFRDRHGRELELFAQFMALQEDQTGRGGIERFAWWTWPEDCRTPSGAGVDRFRRSRSARIDFHIYLQWIADEQLRQAAEAGRQAGLRIGIYRDLAVGVGAASASAWAHPRALVRGVSIGAPPDVYNRLGQNWGLSPLHPLLLKEQAFRPFIAALRANMRHAGALRIDHVMGLMRLFWVPEGLGPGNGAYVAYPFDDLLRIVALESRRHRCLVVGEDLGTVPEGFRPAMNAAGILSYRVMQFERVGDGLFARPTTYPEAAMVTAGTHDLPTIEGFWLGRDLEWRRELGLYPDPEAAAGDRDGRRADRRRLIDALIDAGVWPPDVPDDEEADETARVLPVAVYRFLARTPCRLLMIQIEDMLRQREQINLPGTVDEHPNWRRRLELPLHELFASPEFAAVVAAVANERRRQSD